MNKRLNTAMSSVQWKFIDALNLLILLAQKEKLNKFTDPKLMKPSGITLSVQYFIPKTKIRIVIKIVGIKRLHRMADIA